MEAAVVAVPDKEFGEVVGAWIVLKSGVESTSIAKQRISREEVRKTVWEKMNPQV